MARQNKLIQYLKFDVMVLLQGQRENQGSFTQMLIFSNYFQFRSIAKNRRYLEVNDSDRIPAGLLFFIFSDRFFIIA